MLTPKALSLCETFMMPFRTYYDILWIASTHARVKREIFLHNEINKLFIMNSLLFFSLVHVTFFSWIVVFFY